MKVLEILSCAAILVMCIRLAIDFPKAVERRRNKFYDR